MRYVLLVMFLFYIFLFWPFGFIVSEILFPWGGVAESHLKPIYLGLIYLSGLIVACTLYLAELIKEQKNEKKDNIKDE